MSGERFRPALTSGGVIDVETAAVAPHLTWNIALWGGYALDPLVAFDADGRAGALVNHRIGSNLTGSIALFDWVELGIDLPLVVFQSADLGRLPDTVAGDVTPFGVSDLRLAPKVRLLRAADAMVDLAIIPQLTIPTNVPFGQGFVGEGQITLLPEVAVSRRFDEGAIAGLTLAGNVLARIRPEEKVLLGTPFSHEVVARAGVGYSLRDRYDLPLEIDASTSFNAPIANFAGPVGLELMAGLKADVLRLKREKGAGDAFVLQAFGGAGYGAIGGAGTPAMRGFIGVRGEAPANTDADNDGILDKNDQCPNDAEDKDGFQDEDGCPDLDNDQDGVPDLDDKCPLDAEDIDGFQDEDGCPDDDNDNDGVTDNNDDCPNVQGPVENKGCPWPDQDGDSVFDKDDQCPTEKGLPALAGCPDQDGDGVADKDDVCPTLAGPAQPYGGCPDTDGDGIPDHLDKCPNEPEVVNNVDDEDGCPDEGKALVQLTKEKIVILDKVYFDTGKSTIQKRSFPLLDQVATVIRTHAEIKQVRVEGHTDDVGVPANNLKLSNDRAASVRNYLISKGVSEGRLTAIGYGQDKPAVEGKTKAAREQNRRVEFTIIQDE